MPSRDSDWTPALAYAVGLIATDGCLSSDWKTVVQTSKDADLLATFLDCLGRSAPIRPSRRSFRVQIADVGFYDWLLSIGLTQRKSLTLGRVAIPDRVFVHFARGLLDGDGTIRTSLVVPNPRRYPDHRYQQLTVQFLSASEDHVQWVRETLHELLGLTGWLGQRRRRDRATLHVLRYAKHESIALLTEMYRNPHAPRLERKWIKWRDFCSNPKPTRIWTRRSVGIGETIRTQNPAGASP